MIVPSRMNMISPRNSRPMHAEATRREQSKTVLMFPQQLRRQRERMFHGGPGPRF